MFLLQQLEKTKKEQLAIGAYCVKFGLTKADLRKFCIARDAESSMRILEKVNKVESTEMSKLASIEKEFQLSVRDENDSIVAYVYEDKGKMHAYAKKGYDVIFEKVEDEK